MHERFIKTRSANVKNQRESKYLLGESVKCLSSGSHVVRFCLEWYGSKGQQHRSSGNPASCRVVCRIDAPHALDARKHKAELFHCVPVNRNTPGMFSKSKPDRVIPLEEKKMELLFPLIISKVSLSLRCEIVDFL